MKNIVKSKQKGRYQSKCENGNDEYVRKIVFVNFLSMEQKQVLPINTWKNKMSLRKSKTRLIADPALHQQTIHRNLSNMVA